MSLKCKACDKEFETERKLHAHLKAHDLRVAEYYQKHYPRYDLHDGKIIKFKTKKFYFENDFNNRRNQIQWLKNQPEEESQEYLKSLLVKRKEDKKLFFSPCQVELRSTLIPSVLTFEKYFDDYHSLCEGLGLENKYKKHNEIIKEPEHEEGEHRIYVDTREQKPLKLDYPIEVKTLKYGDYSLNNRDLTCNCYIERKSLADFISTMSVLNYERFCREIERSIIDNANLIILIEDTLTNALAFKFLPYISKKIKATPEYIFHNAREIIQTYPNVQFLFVGGRKESARIMKKIFFSECLYKDIDLQLAYDKKLL